MFNKASMDRVKMSFGWNSKNQKLKPTFHGRI